MSMINTNEDVVVLLSGGLDSSTVLGLVLNGHEEYRDRYHALTINYNQRHKKELDSARKIAEHYGVDHKIMNLDLRAFGGSALTSDTEVPTDRSVEQMGGDIPITYVPGRNTIFISLALAYAETIDAGQVYLGVNALDYSGYPDCRPEYIHKFNELSRLSNKRGVEGSPIFIEAPIIDYSKSQIVSLGIQLGVPYEKTWSCYNGRDKACGKCDSCLLRVQGFYANGIPDPIEYESYPDVSKF